MKKILCLIICLVMLATSGCARVKTYIAYTVYPVGYLVDRIVGDKLQTVSIQDSELVQVSNIVPDYKEILEDTSYFFHIGDLEPYLEIYKSDIDKTGAIEVDLSELNAIYKFERYTLVYIDGKETYYESPYYNSDVFNDIDMYDNDLALWLDPIGMLSMAERIYETLANNYVEAAGEFEKNYQSLKEDLISLDAAYQALATRLKSNNETIRFVTMTANFGNWQKAYGFQIYPVCLSRYGTLPNDLQLEAIKQRIISDNVKYIAYEPNMTDDMINLFNELESELSLTRINLSNLSSLTPSQIASNRDYLALMYENLNVLENLTTDVLNSAESDVNSSGELSDIVEGEGN